MDRITGAVVCVLGAACAAGANEDGMGDRQIAALREMMDAVNAGDAARYARLYAEDATITIYGGGELKGRAAIEAHEVELLRQFPGARLAFHDAWQDGRRAVVHYAVAGRTPGGRAMGHQGLLFYRFHPSGSIAEERRYLDSLTPMAQLGALGAAAPRPIPELPTEMKAHRARGSRAERENVARLKATLAALDSGNEAAFLSNFAADAVLDELMLPRPFLGSPGLREWWRTWIGAVADGGSETRSLLGVGEFVLAETVVRGTLRGPLGRVSASGRPFTVHRALVARLEEGRLTSLSSFMNGRELAEAVGQWPPGRQ